MAYKILIVEDDKKYLGPLEAELNAHELFEVTGVTDSSTEAWEMVKMNTPDAIVLDLQLNEGHGFDLLKKVRTQGHEISHQPHILVLTSFSAGAAQQKIKDFADFILIKNMTYKPAEVISYFEVMEDELMVIGGSKSFTSLSPATAKEKESGVELRAYVEKELGQYSIKQSNQGFQFLVEAVYRVAKNPQGTIVHIGTLYEDLTETFGKTGDSINSSIKRIIKSAFKNTPQMEFERLYPPYAGKNERSAPGNKEFILYVANKIKKEYR
jgi:CheY-like chemotaxis protein